MIKWPPRIRLAQLPTPLTRLERFSRRLDGVNLWVKRDELTGMEVSGNKIRKLEFCIAQALQEGCDTLITCGGEQSNHCRATAILGARLGLKVHLILRGNRQPEVPDGNLLLDYLAGAEVTYVPLAEWPGHPQVATDLQTHYAANGSEAFYIPVGASDEIGLWGYVAAAKELKEDFQREGIEPEYIVTATGSGGTQAGLIAGSALFGMSSRVVAFNVCDDAAWFEEKIRHDHQLWRQRYQMDLDIEHLTITTVEGYVGPGYGKAGPGIFASIAELAACEGLFLDPVYTGKAFHGMVAELEKAANGSPSALAGAKNVVFIHTGGLFGVFPQKQQ
ncbi:MAG: D-cysteine desulfhydrase family protein, partial [Pseudohongiellaceae bacterium]